MAFVFCIAYNWILFFVKFSAPEDVPRPVLEALSSSTVLVTILPPLKPNGIITNYTVGRYITLSDIMYTDVPATGDPNQNISYIDTGLDPYTVYLYFVRAFTMVGNGAGNISSVRTLEAPPTDLASPTVVLNSDGISILIGWQPPLEENGMITSYEVLRASALNTGQPFEEDQLTSTLHQCTELYLYAFYNEEEHFFNTSDCFIVTETDGDITSYIDEGLDPYTYHAYVIFAFNGAGGVGSPPSEPVLTSPAPQPLAGPNATAVPINSSAILVTWSVPHPSVLLGPLTSFTLYGKKADESGTGDQLFSGLDLVFVSSGLSPSTTYTFVVRGP